ncbi:OsmC family protein [Vitreimonas sp.]|jgi:organic hydroperoxide reductase OsmC/OhrA|uniref:OsmC family protein n=1 Tax=Vitreimonas sp. TaxID=3069702 RepID=UPI002EDB5D84
MAAHVATISWKRGEQAFADGKYSRAHLISFDGGVSIAGSSSPSVVKLPLSKEDAADPEELLIAALSSCHMLTFLDLARRAGFVIDSYDDTAEGKMGKNAKGAIAVTHVVLRPKIVWIGEKTPTAEELHDLHHRAHELCFIANSFAGEVVVEETV